MADWYVDFSAGSNGDGSTSSPWNQFTGSENSSVSSGDKVWFRRVEPSAGSKLITWKAGSSSSSRVIYIGWPKSGDAYYSSRDSGLASTWDSDTPNYTYQKINSSSAGAADLPSNIFIHRFYFKNEYTSASQQKAVVIDTENNITFYNSYLYLTASPNSSYKVGVINIDTATNINVNTTTIDYTGSTSYRYSKNFYIDNSTVTFSGCNLLFGQQGSTNGPDPYYWNYQHNSYAGSSTLHFYDCELTTHQSADRNTRTGYSYNYALIHFDNTNTTFSGCVMKADSTDSYTSYGIPNQTLVRFIQTNSNLYIYNSSFSSTQRQQCFVSLTSSCSVTVSGFEWTATTAPQNYLFEILGCNSASLTSISGSVRAGNGDVTDSNYFIITDDMSYLTSTDVSINDVNSSLGNVLINNRDATKPDVTLNTSSSVLHNFNLFITRLNSLTTTSGTYRGISIANFSESSGYYIYGGISKVLKISAETSGFTGTALTIDESFSDTLILNVKYCDGVSKVFDDRSNTDYTGIFNIRRNTGFTSFGDVNTTEDVLTKVYNVMNSYDNGATHFLNATTSYKTCNIYRESGAGYSVDIEYNTTSNISIYYPVEFEDNTWIYLPSTGSYNIIGYVAYSTTDSNTLSTGDLNQIVECMNDVPVKFTTTVLATDSSSTWHNIPTGGSINNYYVKLTTQIEVTKSQYCPVRLEINKRLSDMHVYFDPKLENVSI
jgi:hypothetical protein